MVYCVSTHPMVWSIPSSFLWHCHDSFCWHSHSHITITELEVRELFSASSSHCQRKLICSWTFLCLFSAGHCWVEKHFLQFSYHFTSEGKKYCLLWCSRNVLQGKQLMSFSLAWVKGGVATSPVFCGDHHASATRMPSGGCLVLQEEWIGQLFIFCLGKKKGDIQLYAMGTSRAIPS